MAGVALEGISVLPTMAGHMACCGVPHPRSHCPLLVPGIPRGPWHSSTRTGGHRGCDTRAVPAPNHAHGDAISQPATLVFPSTSSQVRSIKFLVYLMWKTLCKHALSICRMNKQQFLAWLEGAVVMHV